MATRWARLTSLFKAIDKGLADNGEDVQNVLLVGLTDSSGNPIDPATGSGATGPGTAAGAARVTLASDDPAVSVLGTTAGAKVVTDANGTIQQYLRGLVTFMANALGAGTAAAANRVTLASDDPLVAALKAEDSASADGDKGWVLLARRAATPANTSGTDGDYEALQINGGYLWVRPDGTVASGSADGTTNPVKVGAKYNATQPTFADGNRGDLQIGSRGSLRVTLFADNSAASPDVQTPADADTNSRFGFYVTARGQVFNGTTWDRSRSPVGANNTQGTGTAAVGMPLWSTSDLSFLTVTNAAASGDTSLVAAVASQTTRVYSMRLSVAGATVITIKRGSTTLEKFNMAGAGGAVVLDLRDRPYYKTATNEALVLNSSTAVQIDGVLEYVTSA